MRPLLASGPVSSLLSIRDAENLILHGLDVTGNVNAGIGLVDIYDIFGMSDQTIQGADLLAARLNAVVLVPDFFEGDALSHDFVPPDTEEKQKVIGEFLAHKANISRNQSVLVNAVSQYRTRFPSVRKWGAFGLCWGGKVINKDQSYRVYLPMLTTVQLR
jgi:dienelactone hydrolase